MHNMDLVIIYLLFGLEWMGLINLNYIVCFVLHVQYHRNIVANMKDDHLMAANHLYNGILGLES